MTRSKILIIGMLILLTFALGLGFIIEVRYEGASRLPWMPLGIALAVTAGVASVIASVARAKRIEDEEAGSPQRRRAAGSS